MIGLLYRVIHNEDHTSPNTRTITCIPFCSVFRRDMPAVKYWRPCRSKGRMGFGSTVTFSLPDVQHTKQSIWMKRLVLRVKLPHWFPDAVVQGMQQRVRRHCEMTHSRDTFQYVNAIGCYMIKRVRILADNAELSSYSGRSLHMFLSQQPSGYDRNQQLSESIGYLSRNTLCQSSSLTHLPNTDGWIHISLPFLHNDSMIPLSSMRSHITIQVEFRNREECIRKCGLSLLETRNVPVQLSTQRARAYRAMLSGKRELVYGGTTGQDTPFDTFHSIRDSMDPGAGGRPSLILGKNVSQFPCCFLDVECMMWDTPYTLSPWFSSVQQQAPLIQLEEDSIPIPQSYHIRTEITSSSCPVHTWIFCAQRRETRRNHEWYNYGLFIESEEFLWDDENDTASVIRYQDHPWKHFILSWKNEHIIKYDKIQQSTIPSRHTTNNYLLPYGIMWNNHLYREHSSCNKYVPTSLGAPHDVFTIEVSLTNPYNSTIVDECRDESPYILHTLGVGYRWFDWCNGWLRCEK